MFAKHAGRLLDLGCGECADIDTWESCCISHVHAVDIDPVVIDNARDMIDRKPFRCVVDLSVCDITSSQQWDSTIDDGTYDVVSCMMVLEYLNHVDIDFFARISNALVHGGKFIGVTSIDTWETTKDFLSESGMSIVCVIPAGENCIFMSKKTYSSDKN